MNIVFDEMHSKIRASFILLFFTVDRISLEEGMNGVELSVGSRVSDDARGVSDGRKENLEKESIPILSIECSSSFIMCLERASLESMNRMSYIGAN